MNEFVNKNLGETEPEFFYRVSEFMTTFGMDEGRNEPFSHDEDFKGNDLHECKKKAEQYYWDRLKELEHSSYFLPFESPDKFVLGQHAAFKITVALVECYGEGGNVEHVTFGEDDETIEESREIEEAVLREAIYL
jgi:hypothetical protein